MSVKKITFISILILETLLIIIIGVQAVQKAREAVGLRLEVKSRTEELAGREARLKDLESELGESKKARADLEGQVRTLAETAKLLEGKLEGMKASTETLGKQFEAQQKQILSQLSGMSQDSKDTLKSFLDRIRTMIHTKVAGRAETSGAPSGDITLQRIVVKRPREEASAAGPLSRPEATRIDGTILNVDNKYNLVIVDIGQEQGVRPGLRYSVLRGEKKIGEVILREIYKGMSVAEAVEEKTERPLKPNDRLIAIR